VGQRSEAHLGGVRHPLTSGAGLDNQAHGPETLGSPADIARAVQSCRRCGLWANATQGVAGDGPARAPLMLVGEQPGEQEDLRGLPFVGPAGRVLDRGLQEAGIDRREAYVTNAVKHFKHELRGRRRLHKSPSPAEVSACRWWLDREREIVRPKIIVAMGASAVLSVFGRALPVMRSRGRPLPLEDGAQGVITVHPSFILRAPDEDARAAAFRDFVSDLRIVSSLIG
jgi:uracil-DNA glycosylase family protein